MKTMHVKACRRVVEPRVEEEAPSKRHAAATQNPAVLGNRSTRHVQVLSAYSCKLLVSQDAVRVNTQPARPVHLLALG